MKPHNHLISGILLASILIYFFPQIGIMGFLLIIFSTVFIDFDHYLLYIYLKKDFSLNNSYEFFINWGKKWETFSREQKKNTCPGFYCFHGVEILALTYFFAVYVWPGFYFMLIGMSLHLILDMIVIFHIRYKFHKLFWIYDLVNFDESKLIHNIAD